MKNNIFPREIIDLYPQLADLVDIVPMEKGLINKTFLATTKKSRYILQEVSPIFDIGIHFDSEKVCNYLSQFNIPVPKINKNKSDELISVYKNKIFRLMDYVDGQSFDFITSPHMAYECGRVVGQFHFHMADFSYAYCSQRRHKGDYGFHTENLIEALKKHGDHDYFSLVNPFAKKMLDKIKFYIENIETTHRHAHGDPKISNILFKDQKAVCLIDFDTLGNSGWSLEMGDALRSWTNPRHEDNIDACVELDLVEQSLRGYTSLMNGLWSVREKKELVLHSQAVSLCLAIRYLTDVLNENYFSFCEKEFSRPAQHNWLRAQAMYYLYEDFLSKQKSIEEIVCDLF
ncbi:MAG: phosphotransferase [Myxococcales bacterium]|nr:phosphotransferase [Myxococcales bacterium]USN51775.1 MAG: phosphotransferase [Myxococcales bacterium]